MQNEIPSWDDLRLLLAIHRDQSFLAAGKTLGLAPSTLARRMDALETSLGQPLVHRGSEGTRLNAEALRLVALAEEVELGLALVLRDGTDAGIAGTVRLSLPEGFVRPLVPTLARVRAKHPALNVELISESRVVDLARGEADIGLRIVPSTSPTLVSKHLGRANTGLFASRDYVERRIPNARLLANMASSHDWVGFDSSLDKLPHQIWMRNYGAARFVFRSNSAIGIEHAVISGMGIGLLSEAQGREFPSLVQLDLERQPPHVDVFLAFQKDAKKTPRIRVVLKELETDLRRQIG